MANKELDKLLEGYFAPKNDAFGFDKLQGLIKEMYIESQLRAINEVNKLYEKESKESIPARTYTIKEIPYIPISELGWANNDAGEDIPSTQRSQLEQYLSQIGSKGQNFAQKLEAVQTSMTAGFGEEPTDETNIKEYISRVMAHLVFYKTLTMAITNFNASAAGFNFEAFLAALMAGEQIPASGAGTIADFTAQIEGKQVPISLKLYTEGSLKVGGSFTDLVNDLAPDPEAQAKPWSDWNSNPEFDGGAMRYLVCTKAFEKQEKGASPLERKGNILFYEFDLTRRNVFNFLSQSTKGRDCLAVPRDFFEQLKNWNPQTDPPPSVKVPAKVVKDENTVKTLLDAWAAKLQSGFAEDLVAQGFSEQQAVALRNGAHKIYADTLAYQLQDEFMSLPLKALLVHDNRQPDKQKKASYADLLVAAVSQDSQAEDITRSQAVAVAKIVESPYFRDFKTETARKMDQQAEALSKMDWRFARDKSLIEEYNNLPSAAHKRVALRNTRGFLSTLHWELGDKTSKNIAGGKPIATIEIGAPAVQRVLDQASKTIMKRVFDVFENMQIMAESLNTFFANGLQDVAQGKEDVGVGTKGVKAGEKATDTAKDVGGLDE